MGHEGCGAVKAAGMPAETLKTFDPALCTYYYYYEYYYYNYYYHYVLLLLIVTLLLL